MITDGVFSMSGDIAPFDEIVKVAREYTVMLIYRQYPWRRVLGELGRVIVGDAILARRFSDLHFKKGVFAQAIAYPAVPKGETRIRAMVHADRQATWALPSVFSNRRFMK